MDLAHLWWAWRQEKEIQGLASGAASGVAALTQQVTSITSPLNDESVYFALVSKLGGAKATAGERKWKRKKLQDLYEYKDPSTGEVVMTPHRRSEFRKIIANFALPERFKEVKVEEKDLGTNQNGTSKGGTTRFDWRQYDYELTEEDYRLGILEMIVAMETAEAAQFVSQLVSELSALEKAKKQVGEITQAAFRLRCAIRLKDKYRDGMEMGELIKLLKRHKKERAKARAKVQAERQLFTLGQWLAIAAAVTLGGIMMIATFL
jgi:hypothetical protein